MKGGSFENDPGEYDDDEEDVLVKKRTLLGGDANDIVLVFTTLVDESAGYMRFRRVGGVGNILLFVLLFE